MSIFVRPPFPIYITRSLSAAFLFHVTFFTILIHFSTGTFCSFSSLSLRICVKNLKFGMGSVVAGSTYLLAPPPKSYSHNHLIASLLCHPIAQPHLLLQLQRKDPDTRRALPEFDLVSRRVGRRARHDIK